MLLGVGGDGGLVVMVDLCFVNWALSVRWVVVSVTWV